MATRRKSYFLFVLLGLLIAGCVVLYFFFDPSANQWMPKCPFRLFTVWNCPACGLQRALHALLHGRIAEALSYNYFLIVIFLYILALFASEVLKRVNRGTNFIRIVEHPILACSLLALAILWGIVRNLLHV
jgi:hypothetical protein